MKKILSLACALVLGIGFASAQVHQGETAVGANLVYGSEIESAGIGARFQYGITDQLRAEVGLNYFFEHKHMSWWDVNINAHWLVGLWHEQLYLYPLAGINYTMVNDKRPNNDHPNGPGQKNDIGLNIGGGIEYEINEQWGVNAEYRHTINGGNYDQGVFGIGINYYF